MSNQEEEEEQPKEISRLPKTIVPQNYNVEFYFDHKTLEYTIKERIDLLAKEDTSKYLIINSKREIYSIEKVSLLNKKTKKEIGNEFLEEGDCDAYEESIYIPLKEEIKANEELELNFEIKGKAKYGEPFSGFQFGFWSKSNRLEFKKVKEDEIYDYYQPYYKNYIKDLCVSLTLEPIYLRGFMPAFDEPCFKSTFELKVIIDKEYYDLCPELKCFSNGERHQTEYFVLDTNDKYFCSFEKTPIMSTYLFTFVFGPFEEPFEDEIDITGENKMVKIRLLTPIGRKGEGNYSSEVAKKVLSFYGRKFFSIPYFMPKLDLVPIPTFGSRALENLGCIVFQDYALLNRKGLPIEERICNTRTVCHEISHMWFGDLVTMEWWDDLWLNEGFARIFEFIVFENIEKNELVWENFIQEVYTYAIYDDGEEDSTHPVISPASSAKDLDDIFDSIAYGKGSSCIRMIYNYVGFEKFKESINCYLKKYQYVNSTSANLMECFDEVCGNINGKTISEIMDCWLNVKGHPEVSAEIIEEDGKEFLHLTQSKSILKDDEEYNPTWLIPLFIKTKESKSVRTYLMDKNELKINLADLKTSKSEIESNNDFIIINDTLKGFYKCNYSNSLRDAILINYKKLNEETDPSKDDNPIINHIDIYGMLISKYAYSDYDETFYILDKIKPIKSSNLILKFAYEFYLDYKSKCCPNEAYEEFLSEKEENEKNPKEEDAKFSKLIDFPNAKKEKEIKEILFKPVEDNKELFEEINDIYKKYYLYFYCLIGSNDAMSWYIIQKFNKKNFAIEPINKNMKYPVLTIIGAYVNKFMKNKEWKIFKAIYLEYLKDFNISSSELTQEAYHTFLHMENTSDDIIQKYLEKYYLKDTDPANKIDISYFSTFKKAERKLIFATADFINKCFLSLCLNNPEYERKFSSLLNTMKKVIDNKKSKDEEENKEEENKEEENKEKETGKPFNFVDLLGIKKEFKNQFKNISAKKSKNLMKNENIFCHFVTETMQNKVINYQFDEAISLLYDLFDSKEDNVKEKLSKALMKKLKGQLEDDMKGKKKEIRKEIFGLNKEE